MKKENEILQSVNNDFNALEKNYNNTLQGKKEYAERVQRIIVTFIKEYNGALSYNSDILSRLVLHIVERSKNLKEHKKDLQYLGTFFRKYTTIKSVSIKKPSEFTTTDYTVKNGKKYKTVAFKPDIDIENLPLWIDCKPEKTTPNTPVAKKVLSEIKKLLNTIDSIENDTSTLAIVNDIYKSLDNTSKKLEQLLNNINE